MDFMKFPQESFPLIMQMMSPRVQAAAAASVAVTTPVKRAYIMMAKRIRMSTLPGGPESLFPAALFSRGFPVGMVPADEKTVAAMST